MKNGFILPFVKLFQYKLETLYKMSEQKQKRVIAPEQKVKMQEAAKAAREKREADELANPDLKTQRLAKMKEKREAKKAKKASAAEEAPKKEPKKRVSKKAAKEEVKAPKEAWGE